MHLALFVALQGCVADELIDLFGPGITLAPDPEREPDGADTGTAFLAWHGSVDFDPERQTLTATRGLGAFRLREQDFICDIFATYESVGAGAPGCPDCEWSFSTRVTGGGTSGDWCDAFNGPTVFDKTSYQELYFTTYVDGFGWTEAFAYEYGATEYQLEEVVWAHLTGERYLGWYLYGYNFAGSATGVQGDRYSADFLRYATNQNGARQYYYFYY
ncbi:MAG: hypothetical protein EXR71_03820 [Myxococcales bacterium]|nr:hypothetical protein [Myxococcales bacterium]